MGLWSRLRNALTRREQPTNRLIWYAPDQPAGIFITPSNALDVSVVWACVQAISQSLAASRWKVHAIEGQNREWLPDDRLDYVLNVRPNPEMTAIAMWEALNMQALTWGNAYAEIVPNGRGDIVEIWPLFSDRMTPMRRDDGTAFYEYRNIDGSAVALPMERVFHHHGPGIAGLLGDNIVAHMAKTISLAAAQERFASTYFGNNTVIGGVLKHPKKLSPEAFAKLKKDWEDKYKGPFKANKPIILEEGMEWSAFDNNAENAQLVASRTFQIEEICRWYGVPPHKVAHLVRATFNNIEHMGIEFVRDALTPWARRIEQEASYKLLPQRAPWRECSLDMTWLTQGDYKTRMEGHAIAVQWGILSHNDVLRKEGENTIGAIGDRRMVPVNMQPLDMLGEAQQADQGGIGGRQTMAGDQQDAGASAPSNSVAREAVVVLFADVFNRYCKRLKAREEDLRRGKKPETQIASHLAAERQKMRPWLVDECAKAIALLERLHGAKPREEDILASAAAVERGEDPKAAAMRLLPTSPLLPAGNAVVQ